MRFPINATTALGALSLVAAGFLSACGGDAKASEGGYCDELKADKAYFASLEGTDPDAKELGEAFKRMHALARHAPDAVAKDWAAVDAAFKAIEDALADAGLTWDDLAAMQDGGDPPADVDLDKLAALGSAFESLTSGDFDAAAAHIAAHAKKTCGFVLPLS